MVPHWANILALCGCRLHFCHWPRVGEPHWPCEIKLIGSLQGQCVGAIWETISTQNITSQSRIQPLSVTCNSDLLPRDASAERGYEIACRLSVCLSVRLSVTIRYRDHIGWNSSKIISRLNSLRPLLWLTPTWATWCNGNTPKIRVE